MWFPVVLASAALATTVLGQEDFASDCPAPDGFFADAFQCDKYYECANNVISEKLCPDGMAFNDLNPSVEKCDFLYQIDCTTRSDLQPAFGTPECPHANGYFADPDPKNCNIFNYCSDGNPSVITCPENLVFGPKTGTCTWPDQAGRPECTSKNVLNFTCPAETADIAAAHPRYADPQDCQYYFVCISGVNPRHNGCGFGEVFNSEIKGCDMPSNVLECEKYYYDYFDEYFATLGVGSNRLSTEVIQAALNSNYPVPENAKISLERPRVNITNRRRKPTSASAPVVAPAAAPERPVAAPRRPVADAAPSRPAAPSAPRRTPSRPVAPAVQRRTVVAVAATESPSAAAPKPAGNVKPIRRRRPGIRRRKTTTTTTEPPPEYYDDYYYYDEQPSEAVV